MGNAPEDNTSGALDDFQALLQEFGVSMPELDIVGRSRSGLQSDGLADDESHGLGFGLAHLLRGQGATVATMHHLMRDFMHERRKVLGSLHSPKEGVTFPPRDKLLAGAIRSE